MDRDSLALPSYESNEKMLMFTSAALIAVWSTVKGAFGKLSAKQWLILLSTIALALGLWRFHQWSYSGGQTAQKAADAAAIKAAQDELKTFKDAYLSWDRQSKQAQEDLQKKNAALSEQLSAEEAKSKALAALKEKVLIREIPKYIPASADVGLPVGFVRLYNDSLSTAASGKDGQLSVGAIPDAGAPSGLTLASAAPVVVANNAEAVHRGDLIDLWQTWYRENKASFDAWNDAVKKGAPMIIPPTVTPAPMVQ